MRSGPEPFDSPDVQALCASQQAELSALYGEADIGPARDGSMFTPPHGLFLVIRDDAGAALACGGIARFDDVRAELKRMYVVPEARGHGLGRQLLVELETHAGALGYTGPVPPAVRQPRPAPVLREADLSRSSSRRASPSARAVRRAHRASACVPRAPRRSPNPRRGAPRAPRARPRRTRSPSRSAPAPTAPPASASPGAASSRPWPPARVRERRASRA